MTDMGDVLGGAQHIEPIGYLTLYSTVLYQMTFKFL